jgi:integrase
MVRLTKRVVEAAAASVKDVFLWDDEISGFGVRVFTSGKRSYLIQYRVGNRTRRKTIGSHGVWTVETARTEAKILLGKVAHGEDPIDDELRASLTVAHICDRYLTEGLSTAKEGSIKQAKANIENHIKPLLGKTLVTRLTRSEVQKMMRDIAAGRTAKVEKLGPRSVSRVRGGKGTANRVANTLSAALTLAVDDGLRPDNPAMKVKKYPGRKLERFLSPEELVRLGGVLAAAEAIAVENLYAIAAVRLLILTGCRKNEILKLKREWIDTYHRCLRLPDSKTGAKVVHLGEPALRLIASLAPVDGNPHLLPGRGKGTHVTNLDKVWRRLSKSAELENVRIHDLRHSFASMGANNGDSLPVIGALLGHRSTKTTQRYAHLADHPVRAAAERIATRIADYLDVVPDTNGDAGEPADIIGIVPAIDEPDARLDPVLGKAIRAKWLDTRAAAAFLGNTVGTLQTYRWMGIGPEFTKIGRRVVYSLDTLISWRDAAADPAALSKLKLVA